MLTKWFRKRRAWRFVRQDIATMPHAEAAGLMRALARAGSGEPRLLLALAERALATSPPAMVPTYAKWRDAAAAGRRVRIATFPATFSTVPVSDDLRREVEEAFTRKEK
jgi:hypothetical protein